MICTLLTVLTLAWVSRGVVISSPALMIIYRRCLTVNTLDSGLSTRHGHCVLLLGKILKFYSAYPTQGNCWGYHNAWEQHVMD